MASDVVTGIGTTFEVAQSNSPPSYVPVGRVISISGPNLSAERIEQTALDSPGGYKEFRAGLIDGGEIVLEVYWKKTDTKQAVLRDAQQSGASLPMRILWPDSPVTRVQFTAYVTGFAMATVANEGVKATITIKITGAPDWGYIPGFLQRWVNFDNAAYSLAGTGAAVLESTDLILPDTGEVSLVMYINSQSAAFPQHLFGIGGDAGDGAYNFLALNQANGTISPNGPARFRGIGAGGGNLFTRDSAARIYGAGPVMIFCSGRRNGVANDMQQYWGDTAVGSASSWADTEDLPFSFLDRVTIGGAYTDNLRPYAGYIGLVAMKCERVDWSVEANRRLFWDGSASVRPPTDWDIVMGGDMTAAQWNAGINQGTAGGTWSMMGAGVTDV